METEVNQVASEYLSTQERQRLRHTHTFTQTFLQDLAQRDLQQITTGEMVDKYTTLFVSMQEKIQQLLMDGLLKGFYRRDFFVSQVQKIITESEKLKKDFPDYRGSTVIMIDYDNFKLANDTHKHGFGDHVLQEVAKIVRKHLRRQSDILGRETEQNENYIDEETVGHSVGRHGGDELIALLFDTGLEGAITITKRIQEEVDQLQIMAPDGTIWHQTLSIGVADILPTDKSANEVIARADAAVFEAKHLGKNQVAVWQKYQEYITASTSTNT